MPNATGDRFSAALSPKHSPTAEHRMQIADNTVVTFRYTLTNSAGQVLDQSGEEGMPYLHGHGNIIPGLEEAMEGKGAGDTFQVSIPPEKAYGAYDPSLDLRVPKAAFGDEMWAQMKPGMRFSAAPDADHGEVVFTVHALEGDEALVSGNHQLAGETLNFDVAVVEVRAATDDEQAHGHAHGPGGHHHH
jgi:FKBP-type peptidyl-prolyl cis-trans isomerase SlyD